MTALSRLLTRLLLAAALLLLAGLLPAATLLLTRASIALLRLVPLRLVRIVHVLFLPTGCPIELRPLRVESQNVAIRTSGYACETRSFAGASFASVLWRTEGGIRACLWGRSWRARAGPLGRARPIATATKNTLWLPADLTPTMRPSKATAFEWPTEMPGGSVSE